MILSAKANSASAWRLQEALKAADREAPVVLLCQNGKASEASAAALEAAGFSNIYVVAGGVEGLLSELAFD